MGVTTDQSSGIYLNVSYGKLRQKTNAQDPQAARRVYKDKEGVERDVFERVYRSVDGKIHEIKIHESEKYSDQYQIIIHDSDGVTWIVCVSEGSTANKLIGKLANIDPMLDVRITPHYFEKDERSNFTIEQLVGGNWVKMQSAFTKDNPNGMPTLNKKKDGTPRTFDDLTKTEKKQFALNCDAFFRGYVTDVLMPKFNSWTHTELPESKPDANEEVPQDDLPF